MIIKFKISKNMKVFKISKIILLSKVTFLPFLFPIHAQQLRQAAFFTVDQGKAEHTLDKYKTLDEWKYKADLIKKGIIEGAELQNLKPGSKIKATRHSKRVFKNYSVENVFFESIPGVYVTGNLYLPTKITNKIPAILSPHGHGDDPRFIEVAQQRGASLASAGAAIFIYDMIGMGDMHQCNHKIPKAFKLQTINSTRALDFLCQLPFVDTTRIGVTGESGGGTQSFIIAALDNRIKIAAPVVMVSGYFFGGCTCESGMPIHMRETHNTSNLEIASCFAPKPLLLVSNGDDWTKHTPELEFPFAKHIYNLYSASDKVSNVHLPTEKHDYGHSKRIAVYEFFGKYFNLDLTKINEKTNVILPVSKLQVFNSKHKLPDNALKTNESVNLAIDKF